MASQHAVEGKPAPPPKLQPLPGISYLPDPLEISENVVVQEKLATEFVDFLECITDTLRMLYVLKVKHLRSMFPLPMELIREVKYYNGPGPLFKDFEKFKLAGLSQGISPSVDSLLRSRQSAHRKFQPLARTVVSVMQPHGNAKKGNATKRNPVELELIEIVGKKTKPIWHVISLEKQETTATPSSEQPKRKRTKEEKKNSLLRKSDPFLNSSREERLLFSIKFATSAKAVPTTPRFKKQMEMMEAYFAGFTSTDSHKAYLETLQPHWFTDLLKQALATGVVITKDVTDAFVRLGEFMDTNFQTISLARAKICYLVMSLPVWDITRMTYQRALEFILRDILLTPQPTTDLVGWMKARRLPYVNVLPRISKEQEDQEKEVEALNPLDDDDDDYYHVEETNGRW